MTKKVLFEIGVEEVPARFMSGSLARLKEGMAASLKEARLEYESIRALGTPRRLAVLVDGLSECQADLSEEVKGPAKKAAYDQDGNPTRALLGFAKGQGVEVAELTVKTLGNGEYIFAKKEKQGRAAAEILPEILPALVDHLTFPKPMRWGDNEMRFVRPIRWLVALLDGEVIPIRIVNSKSSNVSRGHRFYGEREIVIPEPGDYIEKLRENYVIVDPEERRRMIWDQIQALAEANDAIVEEDEELLEEVVYLLEYPTVLMGSFEEKYLALPKEAVITPMREHQHYFPVLNQDGSLRPNFITVRNGLARNIDIVTAGNEKVLRARLADAEFFYQEDLKADLDANVKKLDAIIFHISLGSLGDKVARIQKLAAYLGNALGFDAEKQGALQRGAQLAKADLVSNMVYEFPELQGIMGEYYAKAAGIDPVIAQSIREHYLPRFAGDELPQTEAGRLISIADKMDSVTGFFAMGIEPTGSQDPYALRRQAMGIVQIILDAGLEVDLGALIDYAYGEIAAHYAVKADLVTTKGHILAFIRQRVENVFAEMGFRYDIVNAAFHEGEASLSNICRIREKAQALADFRGNPEFAALMAGFTRVYNLGKKGAPGYDAALLAEPAEQALVTAFETKREAIDAALAKDDFKAAFSAIAALRAPIDGFLTDIMVMTEDEALRNSRLGLLAAIAGKILDAADFTRIVLDK